MNGRAYMIISAARRLQNDTQQQHGVVMAIVADDAAH